MFLLLFIFSSNDIAQRVDNYLQAGQKNGFAGAVLIAKEGKIILEKGYGFSERDSNTPFSTETITTIGSVTKQFTATAILKLVEMGKLQTGDSLSNFFEDLPQDKQTLTIHQLLTHSAGLIDNLADHDFHHIPTAQFFQQVFQSKLQYEPGSRYEYSNVSYSILARIIELVSGQSYESFLRTELFEKAGMMETGYVLPNWEEARIAHGYAQGVQHLGTLIERFQKDGKVSWALKGNGGIHSTLLDMYKWYEALKTHKILSPKMTDVLTKPYIAEDPDGSSHYAYGWAIFETQRGTKLVTHNGGNGVFFFDFLWFPEEDVVVLFHTNAASRQSEVAWPIARMVFDSEYEPKLIQPNPFGFILSYVQSHDAAESGELFKQLETRYPRALSHPDFLNQVGYGLLERDVNWALAVFEENTKRFPDEANVWDSLGDGYMAKEDKSKAKQAFEKAVSLGAEYSREKLQNLR